MYMCDFETTVFEGQTDTEVWAAACVPLWTEDVTIYHSIDEWFDFITSQQRNVVCYFHNLRFDGAFIMSYLMKRIDYMLAYDYGYQGISDGDFIDRKNMKQKTFKYSISDRGEWYNITLRPSQYYVEIRDSLKLLPFSVKDIGRSFKTKYQKLDMEYEGRRYAGCEITPEEERYIKNDVLVVKEALEFLYDQGYKKTTIASCCLEEFKKINALDDWSWKGRAQWGKMFPNLYDIEMDPDEYGVTSVGSYIRNSYRGGWCYLVRGKENKLFQNGITADVNSLYPSMMHSESGNYYPVGQPHFWKGEIPDCATWGKRYYFVRVRTEFRLKPGKLPCIQIKDNIHYDPTKWVETSDIQSLVNGRYNCFIEEPNGDVHRTWVELTLTMTDWQLIQEHYDLFNTVMLDGCWFETKKGIFDVYINKYREIKMTSTGARRSWAKLALNSLYGKFAANTDSSFMYAELDDEGILRFLEVPQFDKLPGYIPIGSAITSYARNFTIRAAQANYYGPNKRGFIYADTDSIHCDLRPEEIKEIKVDPAAFCCWKLEGSWDQGLFVRQKTYLEHIVAEDLEPCQPHYSVKCAGMPQKCKDLFLLACDPETKGRIEEDVEYREKILKDYGKLGLEFLQENQLDITDFKVGLYIPTGKLVPKQIPGGVLLIDSPYCMRKKLIYG